MKAVLLIASSAFSQINLKNPVFANADVSLKSKPIYILLGAGPHQEKIKQNILAPARFHGQDLILENAFFCRLEDAIAKTSKINFKFRLGSVNYVDALEGKGYHEVIPGNRAPVRRRK